MKQLVSIIIPVYNRARFLREAVQSVLAQSYRPIEIIIIDDGSTDDTAEAIEQLSIEHSSIIFYKRIENAGPGVAREHGRLVAKGEFIQYLDSDDILYPEKLTLQVEALNLQPDCDVCYGKTVYKIDNKIVDSAPDKRTHEKFDHMLPSFLASRWWNTLTPLYRRSVCDRAGPWSSLTQEEDWEYDCRVATAGGKLCFVDAVVCEFRHHQEARLSRGKETQLTRLAERAKARILIYQHIKSAGVDAECEEMELFSRSAFLLSRQCGAKGLVSESAQLFSIARSASNNPGRLQIVVYGALANMFGWQFCGIFSHYMQWLRR